MADAAVLAGVKQALGITSDVMDGTISTHIDSVTAYMTGAGIPESEIAAYVGIVARGVNDLWTGAAGGAKFSPQFYDMVAQAALRG